MKSFHSREVADNTPPKPGKTGVVIPDLSQNGYGGGGGGGGGGGRTLCNDAMFLHDAARMHLIGWQNTWEQAPGVPATPSPP